MQHIFRNFIALLLAFLSAWLVTSAIIILGHSIVPTPEGMDTNSFESIKNNFHLFQTKHFIFPLIAHAMGTFISAYIVSHFAVSHKFKFALGVGVLFMFVSLWLSLRIGHFRWIGILEIALYIPMSLFAYSLWKRINGKIKND